MHNIHLNIPFVVLSTKVNKEGTTEKRFLTPFGTVDVTFRKISSAERSLDLRKKIFLRPISADYADHMQKNMLISSVKSSSVLVLWGNGTILI